MAVLGDLACEHQGCGGTDWSVGLGVLQVLRVVGGVAVVNGVRERARASRAGRLLVGDAKVDGASRGAVR
jgi:hypothetical protein